MFRMTILALATLATVAAGTLSPASAATYRGRHPALAGAGFLNRIPPGVLPCKRGIVWVCQ